jgi:hypothetical protein
VQLHQRVEDANVDLVDFNLFMYPIDSGLIGFHVHKPFSHAQFEFSGGSQEEPALQFSHIDVVMLADRRHTPKQLLHVVVTTVVPDAAAFRRHLAEQRPYRGHRDAPSS